MESKIIDLSSASIWKKSILTYGHFNTIHPGHIRYLNYARKLGDKLIIALIGDNSNIKYTFTQRERADALGMLGIADAILLLNSDEINVAIEKFQPMTLVLGNEYKNNQEIKSKIAIQFKLGGKIEFHAGEVHYATTELLSLSSKNILDKRKELFRAACTRQNIRREQLINAINSWNKTRLIVLGDTIVDQYVACEAIGMSAEAPVVVVKELEHRNFIGGAGIVAAHISALGAQCDLISVVGNDETANQVNKDLITHGIGNSLVVDSTRPTTFKKRYLVENQKLFRVSRLDEKEINSFTEDEVIDKLISLAPCAHGIVLSDFVYGVITPRILQKVKFLAKKHNLLLFGDVQCSSQIGSITNFKNFTLLCPNEREARLALKDKLTGLEQISQRLIKETQTKQLVMKLGPEGFIVYETTTEGKVISQPFPALSVNPLDVAGAGDSLLAIFATGLASGQSMMESGALACCMAALAVEIMGNTPINANTLEKYINSLSLA